VEPLPLYVVDEEITPQLCGREFFCFVLFCLLVLISQNVVSRAGEVKPTRRTRSRSSSYSRSRSRTRSYSKSPKRRRRRSYRLVSMSWVVWELVYVCPCLNSFRNSWLCVHVLTRLETCVCVLQKVYFLTVGCDWLMYIFEGGANKDRFSFSLAMPIEKRGNSCIRDAGKTDVSEGQSQGGTTQCWVLSFLTRSVVLNLSWFVAPSKGSQQAPARHFCDITAQLFAKGLYLWPQENFSVAPKGCWGPRLRDPGRDCR